jgi:nitroreductase
MKAVLEALETRFGERLAQPVGMFEAPDTWDKLISRGVVRRFRDEPLSPQLIDMLCALALCAPSKSDLQQRDIVIVEDAANRARIAALIADQDWIAGAPHFLVFCGNNRRQRQIHQWRGREFANDHLDPFFNAAVDAAIALSAFTIAAEAVGVGCCPVSVIRNHSVEISRMLALPDHVFPVAGLGFGWPSRSGHVSMRLPLSATVHRDRYADAGMREKVEAYDARRRAAQPYRAQREPARFGSDPAYGWSEDKARQYASSERADFGAFVRAKGFKLE